MNELHVAALGGSMERAVVVLSRGAVDIDQGDSKGSTPLMYASLEGHFRVVKALLSKGASVAKADDAGYTALHFSVLGGHLAVTKLLVKAGADLEAKTAVGLTPLHMTAEQGRSEVMGVLIEAGADPNSRELDGMTPLYRAAQDGHLEVIKVLLRAKADPLLAVNSSGITFVPLDVAATKGHSEVVYELIEEYDIKGCGGGSGGVNALRCAARSQHLEVMGILTSAGVIDTGMALQVAVSHGRESSVKFLLQQWKQNTSGDRAGYVNSPDRYGATALVYSIQACEPCSPRITRLLVDAGADTTTAVRVTDNEGRVGFNDTPLALVDYFLGRKKIEGRDATESQLDSLEGTRRLLLRVEAVYAVSWLWVNDAPFVTHAAAAEGTGEATKGTSTPLITVLPVLRRRAGRPRVLLAALFRHSGKPY